MGATGTLDSLASSNGQCNQSSNMSSPLYFLSSFSGGLSNCPPLRSRCYPDEHPSEAHVPNMQSIIVVASTALSVPLVLGAGAARVV